MIFLKKFIHFYPLGIGVVGISVTKKFLCIYLLKNYQIINNNKYQEINKSTK